MLVVGYVVNFSCLEEGRGTLLLWWNVCYLSKGGEVVMVLVSK